MLKSPPAAFSRRSEAQRTETSAGAPSLATVLPVEWRVLARRGWAGKKSGLLSVLRGVLLLP